MMRPFSRRIGDKFAASYDSYEEGAIFHRELAKALVSHLCMQDRDFVDVLEVGAHTGIQTRELTAILSPDSQLFLLDMHRRIQEITPLEGEFEPECFPVVANAEALPFKDELFDLIVSGSTFQWLADWEGSIQRMLSRLKPGGILAFSQFLEPTLEPLKSAFAAEGERDRFIDLMTWDSFKLKLEAYQPLSVEILERELQFTSVGEMRTWMRNMGLGASSECTRPLSKTSWQAIRQHYENLCGEEIHLRLAAGLTVLTKRPG